MEFLVYDEYNKQCATIYFSINKRRGKSAFFDGKVQSEIVGKIPNSLTNEVEKLEKIAKTALKWN